MRTTVALDDALLNEAQRLTGTTEKSALLKLALRALIERESLRNLPQATAASHEEVMLFIDARRLFGLGIGYVDAHLLAATALSPGATLWTRDKRLRAAAQSLGADAGLP
jgi:Arc/MetJ family transcription regulator